MLIKVFSYLPAILQAIIGVEAAIKAPGATKHAIALGIITAAVGAGESVPEAHVAAISTLIDHSVAALNAAGVFGHGDASQATAQKAVGA